MILTGLDWAIIVAYVIFALGVGVWFSRRASESTSEYFLSGRTLPWWVLGTSMVATTFAADTPLAITEFVRSAGIWRNWFWWNVAFAGILAAFLFAPLWRRAEVLTDQELIEVRYSGKPAAFLRAFKALYFSILYNCIVMSWVIAGMTTIVAVLMKVDQTAAVAICIAIALVYSVTSGFWGVVVTDVVQFFIAMGGSIILAIAAVRHPDVGGISGLLDKLKVVQSESLPHLMDFFPSPPGSDEAFLGSAFFKFVIFITMVWWASQNADGGGYIIQRMSAAKDEKHALLSSLWFNVCHYAIRTWPWVVVGLCSLVLFPTMPEAVAKFGHKAGYPLVIAKVLGPGLRGLLVVSFLAAFMSTIDTHLNWGASYLVNDVYKRFIAPDKKERHYVVVSKICVVLLMILAGISSLYVKSISGLWEFCWAMGSGLGMVLILRWFWWRINAYSEITALATSLMVTVVLKILAAYCPTMTFLGFPIGAIPIHIKLLLVVSISAISWLSVTFLTDPEPEQTLKTFCVRVNPGGFWGEYQQKDHPKRAILNTRAIGNWLCGVAFVYGMTFGIGYTIFGQYGNAAKVFGIAFVAFAFIYSSLSRIVAETFDLQETS